MQQKYEIEIFSQLTEDEYNKVLKLLGETIANHGYYRPWPDHYCFDVKTKTRLDKVESFLTSLSLSHEIMIKYSYNGRNDRKHGGRNDLSKPLTEDETKHIGAAIGDAVRALKTKHDNKVRAYNVCSKCAIADNPNCTHAGAL